MRTTSTGSSGRKRALGAGTFALLAVLACAATAGAVPRLFVYEYDYQPAAGSTVDMALAQEKGDPAPAKIIFALQGGTIDVGKVPGTTVGAAAAIATTDPASVFDGSSATFSGPIVAADPADHVTDGTACTGRTTHDAVWTLQLASRGQSLPLTLFVDRAGDSFGSKYQLTACPPSPYVSQTQGGAPFGANLRQLFLHLDGVFRNGGTAGTYHWGAYVTPYTPGTSTPDPREAVEARAITPIPFALGLSRAKAPKGSVRLVGSLSGFEMHFGGDRLDVYAGPSIDKMHLIGRTGRLTNKGAFSFTRPSPSRTTYYQVSFGPVDVTSRGCSGGSPAEGGCVSATLSEIDSNIVKVKPQPRKK